MPIMLFILSITIVYSDVLFTKYQQQLPAELLIIALIVLSCLLLLKILTRNGLQAIELRSRKNNTEIH